MTTAELCHLQSQVAAAMQAWESLQEVQLDIEKHRLANQREANAIMATLAKLAPLLAAAIEQSHEQDAADWWKCEDDDL
jgi:hypothetical protein